MLFAIVLLGQGGAAPPQRPPDPVVDCSAPEEHAVGAIEADRARIRAHLAAVEAHLRAAPTDHLDDDTRARRAAALDTLAAYRAAGEFPHNEERPGEIVPVFRDADGRDCAVGHLVRVSGHGAISDAVDAGWHLARVHTMDPAHPAVDALVGWGVEHGFTVDELARIQPGYCMCEGEGQDAYAPVCGADGITYWNTCVAEVCAGTDAVEQGPCAYEREACPDYQASEPPVVNACDNMWTVCSADEYVYDAPTWAEWIAAQDQACLESAGDPFDGPDALPDEAEDPDPKPASTCGTGPGAGIVGLLVAIGIVARRGVRN